MKQHLTGFKHQHGKKQAGETISGSQSQMERSGVHSVFSGAQRLSCSENKT